MAEAVPTAAQRSRLRARGQLEIQKICESRRTGRVDVRANVRLTWLATQTRNLAALDEIELMAVAEAVDGAVERDDNLLAVVLDDERPVLGVVYTALLADVIEIGRAHV